MSRRRKSILPLGYLYKSATHWRMRAEEMRALAEEVQDSAVRALMLKIAADYDWRAEDANDRAGQDSIMFRVMSPDDETSDGGERRRRQARRNR